jgi:hypothetical protein
MIIKRLHFDLGKQPSRAEGKPVIVIYGQLAFDQYHYLQLSVLNIININFVTLVDN